MTGYPIRIMRDGQVVDVDVDQLTDVELAAVFGSTPVDNARGWAIALAKWIRDHVGPDANAPVSAPGTPPEFILPDSALS